MRPIQSSLAEKHRPKNWDELVLNPSFKIIINNRISSNKPTPGIWISGPSGSGKSSFADLVIKSYMCHERPLYKLNYSLIDKLKLEQKVKLTYQNSILEGTIKSLNNKEILIDLNNSDSNLISINPKTKKSKGNNDTRYKLIFSILDNFSIGEQVSITNRNKKLLGIVEGIHQDYLSIRLNESNSLIKIDEKTEIGSGVYICGKCDVCKGLDVTNIMSYTISDAAQAKEYFSKCIDFSFAQPLIHPNGFNKKIILINEASNASDQALATLFDAIEKAPPYTTWILITMSGVHIGKSHKEALEYRCISIPLQSHSINSISNNLVAKIPELKPEIAQIIASKCKGNMRRSFSQLDLISDLKDISQLTIDDVEKLFQGNCTKESRKQFWDYLRNNQVKEAEDIFNIWLETITDQVISELLYEDLGEYNSLALLHLFNDLSRWSQTQLGRLFPILASYRGQPYLPYGDSDLKPYKFKSLKREDKREDSKDIKLETKPELGNSSINSKIELDVESDTSEQSLSVINPDKESQYKFRDMKSFFKNTL